MQMGILPDMKVFNRERCTDCEWKRWMCLHAGWLLIFMGFFNASEVFFLIMEGSEILTEF